MLGGLVPDGPLHPADAAWALATGMLLGLLARRARATAPVVVGCGVAALVAARPTVGLLEAAVRHERPAAVGIAVAAVAVLAVRRPVDPRTMILAAAAACAPVWALVPDTEAPLLVGVALAGAAPAVRSGDPTRLVVLPAILPVLAAAAGTLGRTERFAPATGAAVLVGVAVGAGLVLIGWGQRAGTPRTVRPGRTSSTTTAPAPTTAP